MRRDAKEKCATRASKKNWPESDSINQNQPEPQRMSRLLKVFRSGGWRLEACFHLSSKVPTHRSKISSSCPQCIHVLFPFQGPGRKKSGRSAGFGVRELIDEDWLLLIFFVLMKGLGSGEGDGWSWRQMYSGCGSLTVEVLFIVQFSSFTLNDTSVIRAYSATQAY
jgi:hypothetical protein